MKIGLTYLKGAVPGFEEFGNLPTNLVKSNGLINGLPAHNELDAMILPGGTLIESNSMDDELFNEKGLFKLYMQDEYSLTTIP